MSAHSSILGGSNAARLLACPASYYEQRRNPKVDVSSPYADEGTLLHNMIAGMIVDGGIVAPMVDTEQAETLLQAVRTLDQLKSFYADGGKFRIVGVEDELPLPNVPGAFGSVDLILANKTTVIVVDWKFGRGVMVKAIYEDPVLGDQVNPQLAFYAAAARAKYKRRFKGKRIVLAVIQPRFPEPLTYVEVEDWELDEFLAAFHAAYVEAIGRDAHREKGEHCRFASCKATCPLWTGPVIDLAKLDPKRAAMEASLKPAAVSEYGAYLSQAMHLAEMAETWAAEIRKQSHLFLEDGGAIPHWKLVPKRGTRKWADEATTVVSLQAIGALPSEVYTEPELRSVAQVETALKKRGVALPEDMWIMVSSGTTIAPSDDPRPESTHGQVIDNMRKALTAL